MRFFIRFSRVNVRAVIILFLQYLAIVRYIIFIALVSDNFSNLLAYHVHYYDNCISDKFLSLFARRIMIKLHV